MKDRLKWTREDVAPSRTLAHLSIALDSTNTPFELHLWDTLLYVEVHAVRRAVVAVVLARIFLCLSERS